MNKTIKYFSSMAACSLLLIASACGGQKSDVRNDGDDNVKAELEKYMNSLTAADTAEVRDLSEKFLTDLQRDRFNEAVSMLYKLDSSGKPVKIDSATISILRNRNMLFPVVNFNYESVKFISPDNNAVKYLVEFDKNDPAATMQWGFNPVKFNDKWYLTLSN